MLIFNYQTDPLKYWALKEQDYSILAFMARRYLCILSTSAASESVFSKSGDIITKKRNKLSKEAFRKVICLKNWGDFADEDYGSDISSDENNNNNIHTIEIR